MRAAVPHSTTPLGFVLESRAEPWLRPSQATLHSMQDSHTAMSLMDEWKNWTQCPGVEMDLPTPSPHIAQVLKGGDFQ